MKPRERRHMKPVLIQGLLGQTLERHGIGKQVVSAMVVKRGNEILDDVLDIHAKPDIKVISYQNNRLKIACRHPAAVYLAQDYIEILKNSLIVDFPDLTLSEIQCRVDPAAWQNDVL